MIHPLEVGDRFSPSIDVNSQKFVALFTPEKPPDRAYNSMIKNHVNFEGPKCNHLAFKSQFCVQHKFVGASVSSRYISSWVYQVNKLDIALV